MPKYGVKNSINKFIETLYAKVTLKDIDEIMKLNGVAKTATKNKTTKLLAILNHKVDLKNDDDDESKVFKLKERLRLKKKLEREQAKADKKV